MIYGEHGYPQPGHHDAISIRKAPAPEFFINNQLENRGPGHYENTPWYEMREITGTKYENWAHEKGVYDTNSRGLTMNNRVCFEPGNSIAF